ncbi:MAG: glucose-1-phosphate adenylyltransferase [Planctomycetaceae bacterium]|nr:glucose-1-phosphate adenylyltransferase [Planctomycetaceae bacterium]
MRNLVSLVLGGGKGTRLLPLTRHRSKPAVPLAGKYRLIDIPISNCLNSGFQQIYVLTQFNSVSLHRHIRQTYNFDHFSGGFVEILAAQQTNEETNWYQGTADAVRKQLRYIEQPGIDLVLILSGDQLYRMNFEEMVRKHRESGADVSISAVPVTEEASSDFGIMRINDDGRVVGFLEKPQNADERKMVWTDPAWLDSHGIRSGGRAYLASMGIYLFNRDVLLNLLRGSDYQDFGKEVFPLSIRTRKVQVYPFDGYWEDIGTIRAFYEANLALTSSSPPFTFVAEESPIYSRPRFLPPTRIDGATIRSSLIADGCVIEEGAVVENSVIGLRCHIGRNAVIRNSILMGTDYFDDPAVKLPPVSPGAPLDTGTTAQTILGVGAGSVIDGAIVDKNCRIGQNVKIAGADSVSNPEGSSPVVSISDGVIVVEKGAVLPDGWSLGDPV